PVGRDSFRSKGHPRRTRSQRKSSARRGRRGRRDVTPKLPATQAGLEALETVVADGSPVIVTEVFSVAQVISVCETWVAAASRSGSRPPFFMSPITGIFGDYLRRVATANQPAVTREAIDVASVLM